MIFKAIDLRKTTKSLQKGKWLVQISHYGRESDLIWGCRKWANITVNALSIDSEKGHKGEVWQLGGAALRFDISLKWLYRVHGFTSDFVIFIVLYAVNFDTLGWSLVGNKRIAWN